MDRVAGAAGALDFVRRLAAIMPPSAASDATSPSGS